MNRYRVLLPLVVHTEDGSYEQGEEFEKEFTADEEAANLDSGLLEKVPVTYRIMGPREVLGHQPGDEFEATLRIDQEATLTASGHIQRVDKLPPPKPTPVKAATKSAPRKPKE